MNKSMQAIRGMNDILPVDSKRWHWLETSIRSVMDSYGYQEIRLPIIEHTEVFARSIGDLTDIVQKEMYSFEDRNGDSLSLRPEGTAGCVRAVLQHGLLQQQSLRVWYQGAMFRHERPQKGRYRQFHQVGAEAFGLPGPDIDAELIQLTARLWRTLNIHNIRLEINSLGTPEERTAYRGELQDYFRAHFDELDTDSRTRLEQNPLRILDSKNPQLKPLIAAAPVFEAYMNDASRAHYDRLRTLLDAAGIAYQHNPRLVRGLDYYTHTVFEWISDDLGAQDTICAGGRYDGLVTQFGGKPTPAVGFALGLERLFALCANTSDPRIERGGCYVMPLDPEAQQIAFTLAEQVRDALPRITTITHCGGGSLKSQMKKADRSGAALALLIGTDERKINSVTIKYLRDDRGQETVSQSELLGVLEKEFRGESG